MVSAPDNSSLSCIVSLTAVTALTPCSYGAAAFLQSSNSVIDNFPTYFNDIINHNILLVKVKYVHILCLFANSTLCFQLICDNNSFYASILLNLK